MASSPMVTRWWGAHSDNYTQGRGGYRVNGIVIHHAVTTNINVIGNVFSQPGRYGSAHYGVGGREVHQYVDENDTAYHCSNWWGNQNTIGIETVNSALGGDYPVADDTLDTLIHLVADIANRYGLGRLYVNPSEDCPKISGHRDWQGAATYCPGDYLYARLQYIADRANDINFPPAPTPQPEPQPQPEPKPAINWVDIDETTLPIKEGGTDLINLDTGEHIKHLDGYFTFIQKTEDGQWVRTQYSRDKGLNNAVLYADLAKPTPDPEPQPEPTPEPTPEPEPTPTPEPTPEPSDETPNWFIRFIQALGEFFINLFKKEK